MPLSSSSSSASSLDATSASNEEDGDGDDEDAFPGEKYDVAEMLLQQVLMSHFHWNQSFVLVSVYQSWESCHFDPMQESVYMQHRQLNL